MKKNKFYKPDDTLHRMTVDGEAYYFRVINSQNVYVYTKKKKLWLCVAVPNGVIANKFLIEYKIREHLADAPSYGIPSSRYASDIRYTCGTLAGLTSEGDSEERSDPDPDF